MSLRIWHIGVFFLLCSFSAQGRGVFVSSSSGSDANDGLSPNAPYRSIEKAISSGQDIFLKAGDIFYGPVECWGHNLKRYGEGVNPMVCGYKRISGQRWKKVAKNIWRLDLRGHKFSGAGVSQESSFLNNIGCLHEWDKDVIHGKKVRYRTELKEDWDIWQTDTSYAGMPSSSFDYLYLFLKRNPNRLKLECSVGAAALRTEKSIIDGIDFSGFGFGISGGTETVIRNCRIDVVGGMLQIGAPEYVCYGNGIEFFVAKNIENCIVEGCVVSRCFDAGMTLQGCDCPGAFPKNIVFRNNFLCNCCQAWEDFLRNGDGARFENCRFENNIIIGSGDSGFGYSDGRFKYCNVLGNNFEGDRGMIIRNNVFIGGNFYCTMPFGHKYRSHRWEGNVCYLVPGSFILANYVGTEDVLRPGEEDWGKVIERYRELTGDTDTRFIISLPEEVTLLEQYYIKSKNESTAYNY